MVTGRRYTATSGIGTLQERGMEGVWIEMDTVKGIDIGGVYRVSNIPQRSLVRVYGCFLDVEEPKSARMYRVSYDVIDGPPIWPYSVMASLLPNRGILLCLYGGYAEDKRCTSGIDVAAYVQYRESDIE